MLLFIWLRETSRRLCVRAIGEGPSIWSQIYGLRVLCFVWVCSEIG